MMHYEIIGIDLAYRAAQQEQAEYQALPAVAICTVLADDGSPARQISIELDDPDLRQLKNLLRRRIDKAL